MSAPEGFFACGAQVRNQLPQGKKVDDISANGLIINYCHKDDWNNQTAMTVIEGVKGDWATAAMCDQDSYVFNMQVKHQNWLAGNDNTATNGLSILCCNPKDGCKEINEHTVETGNWGNWRSKNSTPNDQFVCGVQVKNQDYEESEKIDNTAINGIKLKMCIMD